MDECIIQLEHATVRRAGVPILDDVSFQVRRNEHVAIIGPNGAGKSTLVQ
ncbi:MAG TPA: ABC transporter, partial [Sphaerochaeta sp.]|nr:ABC transporter [Sphaerochaeta sp.]